MQKKWRRTQTATVIGSFVLSMVLASGTAVAQQQERRGSQMQLPSQQEMTQRHNRDIEDRVELRLARSSALAGSDIKVVVEDRSVSLRGTVGSAPDKERALRLARRVRGVKKVEDELSVDKAAVDQRRNVEVADQELAKQVAMKLANETFPEAEAEEEWFAGWEVEGDSWEFDVEVDNGRVTLAATRRAKGARLLEPVPARSQRMLRQWSTVSNGWMQSKQRVS